MTSKKVNLILDEVTTADRKLLGELDAVTKLKAANKLYRDLSRQLHKCTMELAELSRRRRFEEELAACLQRDLQTEIKLLPTMILFLSISKSRDSEIEGLPGKIDSQRNLVSVKLIGLLTV